MIRITLRNSGGLCAAGLIAALPLPAAAWTEVHRGPDHNVYIDIPAAVTDLTAPPAWVTGEESIAAGCRPIIGDGRVYTVATAEDPEERVRIKAFASADGALLAESVDLDVGSFVSFESQSAPAYDPDTDTLFFNTGSTVYSLDGETLAINWSTTLDATNTDDEPGAMYGFVNASPALGAGRVFVNTFDSGFGVEGSQVVGLDAETGAVEWYARTGGRGAHSPLFVDHATAGAIVVVEHQETLNALGFAAFDADGTGEASPLWTSTWTVETGSGVHGLWGDLLTDGEHVYTVTSDFTNGRLVRFAAEDGALEYDLPVPASDMPPVLTPDGLFALHWDGTLRRYDPEDGEEQASTSIAGEFFRDYPAFVQDGLYVAVPGEGLLLFGHDGAEQSSAPGYTGVVSVDASDGAVYIGVDGGRLARLAAPTRVRDWEGLR